LRFIALLSIILKLKYIIFVKIRDMKFLYIFFFSVCCGVILNAQIEDPVSWEFSAEKLSEHSYDIHLKASLDGKWAIYSQYTEEGGPIPTSFSFEKNQKVSLEKGIREEGHLISGQDDMFGISVKKFKSEVDFVQSVNVLESEQEIIGYVTFMVCDDKRCLPPKDVHFSIPIN